MLFIPIQPVNPFHLFFRQFKIKQFRIFPDMVGIAGTRYYHTPFWRFQRRMTWADDLP